MPKYLVLEFEDGDEHEASVLIESMSEYNFPIIVTKSDGSMHPIRPTLRGHYDTLLSCGDAMHHLAAEED